MWAKLEGAADCEVEQTGNLFVNVLLCYYKVAKLHT